MSKELIDRLRREGDGVMSTREKRLLADTIERLEHELAEANTTINHAKQMTEMLEQQLAAAIAACKLKDEYLEAAHNGLRWWMDTFPLHVTEADNEEMLKLVKALAIQPDDSALKAWLGEPVAWLHQKRQDCDVITDAVKNVWNGVVVGRMAQYSIPLYVQKGLK